MFQKGSIGGLAGGAFPPSRRDTHFEFGIQRRIVTSQMKVSITSLALNRWLVVLKLLLLSLCGGGSRGGRMNIRIAYKGWPLIWLLFCGGGGHGHRIDIRLENDNVVAHNG